MNLTKCELGHFFDREKYVVCPQCAGGKKSDENATVFLSNDVAESLNPILKTNEVEQYNLDSLLPIADILADPIDVNSNYDENNSVSASFTNDPFDMPIVSGVTELIDEDDNTIGFFGERLFSSSAEKMQEMNPVDASVPAKNVNKVSSPCVGWLIALSGSCIGTDYRLKTGKNFVGRSPKMDIALIEEKSVSRDRHTVIVYEPKEHLYMVQPGEASTLVYRNNEVVLTPMKLEAYDVITVGEVDLLFIPLCSKEFNWNSFFEKKKQKEEQL